MHMCVVPTMPPKKSSKQEPSKKTVEKKKDKIIEDKTFGLKNKKGKKQQQYVKQVANQVKFGGQQNVAKRESAEFQAKQRKTDETKEKQEMNSLFRPVQTQKVSAGADPKSVLCIFFTQGQCTKGDKCKFSHDLSLAGKTEKRSLYVDSRDLEEDTIDKWDEEKLKEVVDKKHGEKTKQKTDIVCKHFLHAIEKAVYGWFWECPNGEKCIYRHALPPGFVFKKVQKEAVQEETITMEELVEREREQLVMSGRSLTKVTLETFTAWKERKLKEKQDQADAEMARRKEAFSAGKTLGISGREMFEFNPNLIEEDDEEAGEDVVCYHGSDDEDAEVAAVPPLLSERLEGSEEGEEEEGGETNHKDTEDVDGDQLLGEATGGGAPPSSEQLIAEQQIVVDESLFDIENLDDLNIDEEDIMD